ncbi:hypothetical protein SAMN04487897_1506 [Paenibacillus sp. yr247]|uniref:Wadjet anti-phage system protein JetD domain-containing protein n=1 Tax=Paenibacillus sp. yr247 TaxID=1761880 RepID=UPI00088DD143|nr:Wadjet anti-phage system protein JetD domain-containing protein [Paenibacillus sp. yr247]SDP22338.1 hypothetical protein SAMN04487897_1506 [Paenibacillus sp. yr247]
MKEVQLKMSEFIKMAKQATVWTEQLEKLFDGEQVTYEQFAEVVLAMEETGLLTEVKSAGRRSKRPSLANRYRIQNTLLKSNFQQRLHRYRLDLHPFISLDRYFALGEVSFDSDLPYIQKIHHYLQNNPFPDKIASAPERSFALVGDEKWVTERGGKSILERIGLWDKLLIESEYDPLMLAINPPLLSEPSSTHPCLHLIVENKATFQALLPALTETLFHSLIYGCGNKIVGNIDLFPLQYPVKGREHLFYYFGDLDHSGIQIWYNLSKKIRMIPALPFYSACMEKEPAKGKANQRRDNQALQSFLACFPFPDRDQLDRYLTSGNYYPQETLSTRQLQQIWRDASWI